MSFGFFALDSHDVGNALSHPLERLLRQHANTCAKSARSIIETTVIKKQVTKVTIFPAVVDLPGVGWQVFYSPNNISGGIILTRTSRNPWVEPAETKKIYREDRKEREDF